MSVPAGWTCPPEYFNDGFACDCNCAVLDPDCALPNAPVYNCGDLQTCSAEGVCVGGLANIPVHPNWQCPESYWNANDGCDCDCGGGARDPDCDRPGTLWGCTEDQFCNSGGQCQDIPHSPTASPHGPLISKFPTTAPPVPAEWTCPEEYWADGYACDCNCGVVDPDCVLGGPVFNCEELETCSAEGLCTGGLEDIPVSPNWVCPPEYWNVNDGCDCACGAYDPDCDRPGTLWNCAEDHEQFCNAEGECQDVVHSPTASPHGPIITKFPTIRPPVPAEWTCPEEYWADGFACDCDCGAPDTDCERVGAPVYNCGDLETCSPEGTCTGGLEDIPVDPNWVCPEEYWNVNDGCDCDCGAYDPDCDRPGTLWNCQENQFCDENGSCADIPVAPTAFPTNLFITHFPTVSSPTTDSPGSDGGFDDAQTAMLLLFVGILAGVALALLVICCVCTPVKVAGSGVETAAVAEETKKDVVVAAAN